MFNLKSAFIGLCSAFLMAFSSYAAGIGLDSVSLNNTPHIQHNTTIGLKPVQPSYKIARLQYLPDLKDSENGWAGNKLPTPNPVSDKCSYYPLASCPAGGNCTKCPFGNRYKLNSCRDGWKISGNSCVAASCSALNKSYLSDIPSNQVCTKVTEGGLTCYKDCRAISCDGYKINCDNGVSGSNIISSALCPDCMNDNAKCSPKLCKITACATNYKTNADNTACVEKDDTCPDNYFKTCETSVIGDPKYTERGTACYQCKPKIVMTSCAALNDAISNASAGDTITLDADVTCTNTSVTLKDNLNLDGAGHTLTFNLTTTTNRPGLILGKDSEVSNLTVDLTSKYRGEKTPYVIGVVKNSGVIKIPDTAGNNTLNNVNIYLKADTETRTDSGYYPMVAIEASPLNFKGTVNIIDKGSVCNQDTNNLTYPNNAKTPALWATDTKQLFNIGNNAIVNIKTNGCWSIGINYASMNISGNAKLNIETYGSSSGGYNDTSGSDDGTINISDTAEVNIFTQGKQSSGMFAQNLNIINSAVLNIYSKNYSYGLHGLTGSGKVIMKNNAKANIKTSGSANYHSSAFDGDADLYGYAQLNTYNTGSGEQTIINHVNDIALYDNAEFNGEATASTSDCVTLSTTLSLNSANAKLRLKCGRTVFASENSMKTEIKNAIKGATIDTSAAKYTCSTPFTTKVTVTNGNAVDITNFTKNTSAKLTSMPAAFKSIFSQGIFTK